MLGNKAAIVVEPNIRKQDIKPRIPTIATAKTVSELDPTYAATNLQFRRFTAWNIQRAMSLFAQGRVMTQFTWVDQDAYAAKLRTSPEAEPLRQFARTTWGTARCQTVLGF